ncbi:MAG TPA: HAMP domain-containing sensor histidine kinase [Phycisphaerae bacterium]|nr:HAMP domain-containing sensor histidine kinase [Phycisphaerae bacterium]HRR85044.1 HAMP domain-containing sensor histidine kinase [Phycisphaerae bacterium]
MRLLSLFQISLARKCQLLFGLAVLLIIAAALFVPGYYMGSFVDQMHVQRAQQLAAVAAARIDPAAADWRQQQKALDQWWEVNEKVIPFLKECRPRVIKLLPADSEEVAAQQRQEFARLIGNLSAQVRPVVEKLKRRWDPPAAWQVARFAWESLPEHKRDHCLKAIRRAAADLGRAFAIGNQWYPPLDEFQKNCVERMLNEGSSGEGGPMRSPDGPTVYRYIQAVRGSPSSPSTGHPLIGIIDISLSAPITDELRFLTRAILVLAGLLAGFLAILVFYLISQRLILAPVRELTALAGRIAGGDLQARASLQTGDEYEKLSDAFNDMLVRLEQARAELETANRSLDAKLGELAETNVALFESNRIKSEFLANVSHELRTPLTSIIGFADLLRDSMLSGGQIDVARAARFADNILVSGRGLLDLINDLLDLAKIEARKIELHRTVFSLRDVCEALCDFVRPNIEKKSLVMTTDIDENLPMMTSDAGKLRQILFNLLSNAIKYTPEGGSVRLEVRVLAGGRWVRLAVIDNGPGIAPEDQGRIFEKFHQLDSSVTREHSGSGLGLAISKELCTMLGGTIRVESELGQGSRFIVELPVECPESAERPPIPLRA